MTDHLAAAEKALAKNDVSTALAALLDAWREKRAPAYADAIDALSKVASSAKPETHEAWVEVALQKNADDVGPLVDAFLVGKISTLGAHIEQLAARPDDPRVAMCFARAALEPPFTASSNFTLWTKMYDAMTDIADSRVATLLEKRLKMPEGDSKFWPRHYKAIEKILKKLPAAPTVGADEKKRLGAIAKSAKDVLPAAPKKRKAAPAPKSGEPLERAAIAAEAGEWRECITALLDAWRPLRAAVFANAIDRVSEILEDGRPMPNGKKLQAAWTAMAAKNDVADIGLLAQSSSDPKNADADSNMDLMITWPEDPRIGAAALAKVIGATFADRTRSYQALGTLVIRNHDERFTEYVARLADMRTDNKARNGCIGRLTKELAPVLAKIKVVLGPQDEKWLARVNKAVDAFHASDVRTERKFIADIVADSESDGPRLVYADWLTERDHPRGELIVLQCAKDPTAAQKARIAELIAHSTRALLGPLANCVYQVLSYEVGKGGYFDRGMPCYLSAWHTVPTWLVDNTPLLALIDSLHMQGRGYGLLPTLVAGSKKLRRVENMGVIELASLCSLRHPSSVEELEMAHWREADFPLATLTDGLTGSGLANVKKLDFAWGAWDGPNHRANYFAVWPDGLLASPLLSKVEHITQGAANIAPLIAGLKKHDRNLRKLTVARASYEHMKVDIDLDKDMAPTAITVGMVRPDTNKVTSDNSHIVFEVLRELVAPKLTSITFAPGLEVTDAVRKNLETLVAERFKRATVQ